MPLFFGTRKKKDETQKLNASSAHSSDDTAAIELTALPKQPDASKADQKNIPSEQSPKSIEGLQDVNLKDDFSIIVPPVNAVPSSTPESFQALKEAEPTPGCFEAFTSCIRSLRR